MGRKPKDVFSYPQAFFQIVEAVALRGEVLEVGVQTLTEARSLRGKFYTFRQALERAVHKGKTVRESIEAQQLDDLENNLQYARRTVCWFEEGKEPVTIKFMDRDGTPEADLLARALASAKGEGMSLPGASAEDTFKRLQEKADEAEKEKDDGNPYY